MFQGENSPKILAKIFFANGARSHPGRKNHRAPNRLRFFARIARRIAVIGGTGGVPSWLGVGVACQCASELCGAEAFIIRRAGALRAEMDNTLLRSGRSTALRPTGAVYGAHWRTGFGKEHVNSVRVLMEEQEGKTWKGTASDLYNRLKEIIGEATGAEPTDEQPRPRHCGPSGSRSPATREAVAADT